MLGIIAAVAMALVAFGQPAAPQLAQSEDPIRVVSSSHEVRFPHEVVFRLEAEAAFPITEVALYYRLARRNVKVYGYPEFVPATRVSTDFRLKTGGSAYIPIGVDIEYYYLIVDEAGNALETEHRWLEYRDTSYRWQELRHGELVVMWHDRPEARVEEVTAKLERRLEEVREMLGLGTSPPIKAVVLNGSREAERGFPTVSDAATRGHLYGGFAFREYDLFVLVGLSEDGMVHESTHLMLNAAVATPLVRVPSWLNEGLAMYFESGARRREPTLARAVRDDELMSLRQMRSVPGRPEDVRVFYAQSWSIVKYMIDTYGRERMTSLIRSLDEGTRFNAAVEEVYGVSLEELEGRWRDEITGSTTLAPRPDLGTVATTTLIAASLAVSIIAWIYRWFTHRAGQSGPASPAP